MLERAVLERVYDLAVIGGGLNGAAIARDAAGRGLSVFLCDAGDIGGEASSQTPKVAHGRLSLIERLDVGRMREVIQERETLMRAAPHLVRPIRFRIPYHDRLWSKSAFSIGLFALDHAARNSLPRSRRVRLEQEDAWGELQGHFALAFEYGDCVVDDARLAIANALDAQVHGASIYSRVRCVLAEREGARWRLSLETARDRELAVVFAAIVVNAAGASSGDVHNHIAHARPEIPVQVHRQTSILVRRRDGIDPGVAYALPDPDGQIVYAVPMSRGLLHVGPANSTFQGGAPAGADRAAVAHLADVAAQYLHTPIARSDIVRTSVADRVIPVGTDASGHAIRIEAPPQLAPLISVFGGDVVGHRKLAAEVVDGLARFRPLKKAWTATASLPGGGFPRDGARDLVRALRAHYPFVKEAHARRLIRTYGTRATNMLTGARNVADLGLWFGGDLYEAEVRFLREQEWAVTAEDILWRRTKLGLSLPPDRVAVLSDWLANRPVPALSVI